MEKTTRVTPMVVFVVSNQQPEDKPSYQELKKKYDTLVKDHERVGQSFQNQRRQNQELAVELEEQEKDAEELTNLVQTKSEVIKTLQTKLADAKRTIAELKAELKTLRQRTADEPQQQPQQKDATRASTHSLATIHTRYPRVLQILKENNCSMANAFRLAGCPRSTLRDFIAIAELRIVDEREFESASREICVGSVKDLETVCRRRLRRHLPAMANMRREGQLLPLKFDDRLHN